MELDFVFIPELYQMYSDSNSAHVASPCNKGGDSHSLLLCYFLFPTSLEIQSGLQKIRLNKLLEDQISNF